MLRRPERATPGWEGHSAVQVSVCVFCVAHRYTSGWTVALRLSVPRFTSREFTSQVTEQAPQYVSHLQHLAEQGSDVGLSSRSQCLLRHGGVNTRMTMWANRRV